MVEDLNEEDHCAVVRRANPDYYTTARDVTQIEVLETQRPSSGVTSPCTSAMCKVTTQVVSFQRKAFISNEILGEEPLELGARDLFTKAVWFTMDNAHADRRRPGRARSSPEPCMPPSTPLSGCCRWWPPATAGTSAGCPRPSTPTPACRPSSSTTAIPAARVSPNAASTTARVWLTATRDAIKACECESGCPSCVQSPKCGNKNNPLDKAGAVTLIEVLLSHAGPAQAERHQTTAV